MFIKRSPNKNKNNNNFITMRAEKFQKRRMQMQKKKCKNYATICIHVSSAHTCRRHYQTLQWNKYMQLTHEGCLEAFSMASAYSSSPSFVFLHSFVCTFNVCIACSWKSCACAKKRWWNSLEITYWQKVHGCVRKLNMENFNGWVCWTFFGF